MSKRTFKIRKNCLNLSSVNYKFINLPIFTPPHFANFYIFHSLYFECKDTSFPFSTYAICAICVDSGNKVQKISWNHSEEYLRRIRNFLRKIAEYLRRIRNYLRKIAEFLRRINPEDKCR